MSSIAPWLAKAGAYAIARIPCPDFAGKLVDLSAPRTGVLHTTEGGWDGSMGVFHTHFAPHFIIGVNAHHRAACRYRGLLTGQLKHAAHLALNVIEPSGVAEIAQLVPLGIIGAALVTHNDHAIAQIEMVGYAQDKPWLPEPGTLDALSSLMLALRDACGIPLTHPWKDGDFGHASDNPHRHAGFWGKVPGWYGHGDCPEPDSHWDPGALRWSQVFAHADAIDAHQHGKAPAPKPPGSIGTWQAKRTFIPRLAP